MSDHIYDFKAIAGYSRLSAKDWAKALVEWRTGRHAANPAEALLLVKAADEAAAQVGGHLYGDEPTCAACGHDGPNDGPEACVSPAEAAQAFWAARYRIRELEAIVHGVAGALADVGIIIPTDAPESVAGIPDIVREIALRLGGAEHRAKEAEAKVAKLKCKCDQA